MVSIWRSIARCVSGERFVGIGVIPLGRCGRRMMGQCWWAGNRAPAFIGAGGGRRISRRSAASASAPHAGYGDVRFLVPRNHAVIAWVILLSRPIVATAGKRRDDGHSGPENPRNVGEGAPDEI